MRTIHRPTLAAVALVLAATGTAACSAGSPTAVDTAPAGPHFESGLGFGSGNVVAPNAGSAATQHGGVTFGSGNFAGTDANTAENTVAADTGSTATRSGVGFGSGN
jgi:hypothetical protein